MNNADEFLQYISKNIGRLKRNLRKNITFDPELFDDIFYQSIIKCYDTILKNNLEVKDFENYFFVASKFNFINSQNKLRKHRSRMLDISVCREEDIEELYSDNEEENNAKERLKDVREKVAEFFGTKRCELFFDFYSEKISGEIDISALSEKHGYTPEYINTEVLKIKRFLSEYYSDKYIKSNSLF